MRKIVINWSYPIEINHILNDIRMSDIGLYYITRNFGGKVSDLYIGKTTYDYRSRLKSHQWDWLNHYRGKKYVRLGTIISPENLALDNLKQLINDTEATLIYCCRRQLIHNTMCTKSYTPSQQLHIINTGRRGNLPTEVFTKLL